MPINCITGAEVRGQGNAYMGVATYKGLFFMGVCKKSLFFTFAAAELFFYISLIPIQQIMQHKKCFVQKSQFLILTPTTASTAIASRPGARLFYFLPPEASCPGEAIPKLSAGHSQVMTCHRFLSKLCPDGSVFQTGAATVNAPNLPP